MISIEKLVEELGFVDTEKTIARLQRYRKTYPNKDIHDFALRIRKEEQVVVAKEVLVSCIEGMGIQSQFVRQAAIRVAREEKNVEENEKGNSYPSERLEQYLKGGRFMKLIESDFRTAEVEPESVDLIITDPPYPKEFLNLYADLAQFALRVLKPGGSLFAMAGQSYLPEIMELMRLEELTYNWTLCYLTPGGQSPQLWQRKVNTFWKPIVWYIKGKPQRWMGDVVRSEVNDNDKNFHFWGQSISGMSDLVKRVSFAGETVLDPFMGGGTTGAACLYNLRNFIGIELDPKSFRTAKERLEEIDKKMLEQ